MPKLTRSLFGAIIAVASISLDPATATSSPAQIQQPAPNLQAQFFRRSTSDKSSSFGDYSQQIDRPAGFGSLNGYSPSSHTGSIPGNSIECPARSNGNSVCDASTTTNVLKSSPSVDRSNDNAAKNRYRVRWSNSSKLKKSR